MQRQRFITTIKNVTKEKIKLKSLIDFIVPVKSTATAEGQKGAGGEIQKNLQNMSKNKNNKCIS